MLGLVRASHPGPTAVVTAIAVLLGERFGLTIGELALVGITVLVGQLSIGWSNDWLDSSRDLAAGRSDKPVATGKVTEATARSAALVSGAATIPLSLLPGWRPGLCHLLLVASGWGYNLGLKRTVWSPIPYFIGFGALPAYVALVGGAEPGWWMVAAGGLLGVSAHFANAAPDIEADRELGVLGVPQRVGVRGSLVVSLVVLTVAGLLAVLQLPSGIPFAVLAVLLPPLAGAVMLWRADLKAVFPLVMAAALVDVLLLVMAA